MSPDPNKKMLRQFQCRESLWQKFEQMARELECSVDYLINDAMKQYARQRGYAASAPSAAGTASSVRVDTSAPPSSLAQSIQQPGPVMGAAPHAGSGSELPPMPGTVRPAVSAPPPLPANPPAVAGAVPAPHRVAAPPSPSARYGAPPTLPGPGLPASAPLPAAGPHGSRVPVPPMPPPAPPAPGAKRVGPPPMPATGMSVPAAPPMPPPAPPPPAPVVPTPYAAPHSATLAQPGMQPGVSRVPPPPPAVPPGHHPRTLASAQPTAVPMVADAVAPKQLQIRYQGQTFPVNKDKFVIGRGKQTSDLTIKDPNVSRQHAMIEFDGTTYFIVDLGSTNGLEYLGQRIQRKALSDGDIIRICDHEMTFLFR